MKNEYGLESVLATCFDNNVACQKVNEFLSEFDEELIEKFIELHNYLPSLNSSILLNGKDYINKDKNYSLDFDFENSELTMAIRSKSHDKIVKTAQTMQVYMPPQFWQLLDNNEFKIDEYLNRSAASLVFSTKVDGIEDNVLPNQNHTKAIAELETSKKENYLTFEYTPADELLIGQKVISRGKVDAFDVKRLKNKDFLYVMQQKFLFNPNTNYPIQKNQRKRFQISHKNVRQAWLAEDTKATSLECGLECLEHSYKGSPYLSKIYYNGNTKGRDFYLASLPQNPFEIRSVFDDEKLAEIDYSKALASKQDALIAHKIYARHLKKLEAEKEI